MQSPNRRTRAKAALRERILEAARELFAKDGYEAVTMRAIARRIDYTATAIYYHFPDKQALLHELCDTDFQALSRFLNRIGTIPDPLARMKRMGIAYVEFGLEYPQHYRLLFMTPGPVQSPRPSRLQRGNPAQDAYAFLRQAVDEALRAQRFRPEFKDPDLITQILWSGAHGLVSLHLAKGNDRWIAWRPARKVVRVMVETMVAGFLRNPARS